MFWYMKRSFKIYLALSSALVFVWFIMALIFGGYFAFCGFGVDSTGNLYVGYGQRIEIYNNQVKVYEIRNRYTSRGYVFTVQSDDTLLLGTGTTLITLSLDGELIEKVEDYTGKTSNLRASKRVFLTDGKAYTASRSFGRLQISQGEEIVYQQPLPYYVLYLLSFVFVPLFVVNVLIVVKMLRD